jgi:iron complex transport system ATP-binding protein
VKTRIDVKGLGFSYGGREALRDISFCAGEGELVAVLGPNGSGKSTLFRCILGILQGYSGSISISGDDIRTLGVRDMAKRIAYIPQSHYPAFNYSVLDMVMMGSAHRLGSFSRPGAREEAGALDALALLGISALASRSFLQLSGGERQLVLIARALAQRSDILVMDEPASSLDYGNQLRLLKSVGALSKNGYTVLFSTHTPQHALSYADRVLALEAGSLAADGPSGEALTEALMQRLYGVRVRFIETPEGRVIAPLGETEP